MATDPIGNTLSAQGKRPQGIPLRKHTCVLRPGRAGVAGRAFPQPTSQFTAKEMITATTVATTIIFTSSMFPSASVSDAVSAPRVYDGGAEGFGS
jgi:hypothetical protein